MQGFLTPPPATVASSVFDTGNEVSFGDAEIKTLGSHFHRLISNHALEKVTEDILSGW
jgi:hypothetical protein